MFSNRNSTLIFPKGVLLCMFAISILFTSIIPFRANAAKSCAAGDTLATALSEEFCYHNVPASGQCEAGYIKKLFVPTPTNFMAGNYCLQIDENVPFAAPTACSLSGGWSFDTCIWIPLMSALGTIFLTIGGAVLLLAGVVFDWFVQHLVVNFRGTIEALNLLVPIQRGWQLFRDLSNIAIIGVFVFVAIMTILGSAEYGAKRLISRVLIVAILINFSLLFTRMVVDSTNFVSAQVMKAMPQQQAEGIAQSFLNAFGIKDVWSGTSKVVERVGTQSESGWAALLYGFFGGAALLLIACVLLYGAYVIIARALLLVIAMITSSLAFASYLLPATSRGTFVSWDVWWSNLLKAALFGPLLMIFLWIALQFISLTNANTAGAAIGAVADDPSKASDQNWYAIILLIFGTGLLFVAIRAASSFAASIGGFSTFNLGAGASLALGARSLGFLGRVGIGRPSAALERLNDQRLADARVRLAGLENSGASAWRIRMARGEVNRRMEDKALYGGLAKSNFNAMNTGLKSVVKGLGAGAFVGGKTESIKARYERIAKEAAKKEEARLLSKTDQEKLADKEKERAKEQLRSQREIATQQREAVQEQLGAAREMVKTVKGSQEYQQHEVKRQEAERAIESIRAVADEKTKQMTRAGASQEEVQKHLAERDSQLMREKNKIEEARAEITKMERAALQSVQQHETTTRRLDKDIERLNKPETLQNMVEEGVKKGVEFSEKEAEKAAAHRAAGWFGSTKSTVAGMAGDEFRKALKSQGLKDRLKAWKELDSEGSVGKDKTEPEDKKAA